MSKINYIKCSHCQADNDSSLSYCSKCGSPIGEITGEGSSGRRIALYILLMLLIFAVIFAYFNRQATGPEEQISGLSADEKEKYENRLKELESRLKNARKELATFKESEDGVSAEIPDIPLDDLKANENAVAGWIMVSDACFAARQ